MKNNADTLLPCPFCGRRPRFDPGHTAADPHGIVQCVPCSYHLDGFYFRGTDELFAAWNTRAPAVKPEPLDNSNVADEK